MRFNLGKRFKQIRKQQLKLSQEAMAPAVGMKLRHYQDVETNKTDPSFGSIQLALEKLKIGWAEFTQDRSNPAHTVGQMTPAEMEALVARASRRDGTINLENERLKKKVGLIPEEIFDLWPDAKPVIQSLCQIFLTPWPENEALVHEMDLSELTPAGKLRLLELLRHLYQPTTPPSKS